jgi:hypothetical protein
MNAIALTTASGLIGMAWGQENCIMIGAVALIPLLWNVAKTRAIAGLSLLAYYLVAARGIPHGAGIYFAETAPVWAGWSMWIAAALVNASPWVALWNPKPQRRLWGLPMALILTAIPPLGIVGWTNPLMAAGVVFPGTGYAGIILLIALLIALAARLLHISAPILAVAAIANLTPAAAAPNVEWHGIDTSFSGDSSFASLYRRLSALQRIADAALPNSVTLLSESYLGDYDPAKHTVLRVISNQLKSKNSTIIAGAQRPSSVPGDYQVENVLLALGVDAGQAIVQRMPVPFGMWKPWDSNGYKANFTGAGIATIHGKTVAGLICYEELLVWPVMLSMHHLPDMLLGSANDWWARDTSIPAIQRQSLALWGRLFAIPTVGATNA